MVSLFEYIIGDIVGIYNDYIVLQNSGIGYKIYTSINTMHTLQIGDRDRLIYTELQVREDGVYLYGFSSEDEMNMYKLLLLVTKIGPKVALGILSSLSPNKIKIAIINKDIETLCKAPGVGKKTAERIILELKDRIDKDIIIETESTEDISISEYDEAVQALMSLGYSRFEVDKAIRSIDTTNMDIEKIIREGLKKLSKH